MAVTARDVAREAQVSVATVSRVINGHSNVTDHTRARIIAIADRLRYVPDNAARGLVTGLTHTVGVLLPDLHGEFFSEIIRGIDTAARRRGLHLLLSGMQGSADEAARAIRALKGRIDGLLMMSPYADCAFLAAHSSEDTPTVLMNSPAASQSHSSLCVDNRGGARTMTRHLLECGHRHIAFIEGPEDNFDATERLAGFREGLVQRADVHTTLMAGDFSENSGYHAGQKLAALRPRPEAVFAANDMMALGCLLALRERGIDVPKDLALAGFDDVPVARVMAPALTTVRVHMAELGERALAKLAAAIAAPSTAASREQISTQLVVRDSCGARGARGKTR